MQLLLRHRLLQLRTQQWLLRVLLLLRATLLLRLRLLLRTLALPLRTLPLRPLPRLRAQASKLSRRVRLWRELSRETVSVSRAVRQNATDSCPWRFAFWPEFSNRSALPGGVIRKRLKKRRFLQRRFLKH
jgi:hypothetical protein